MEQKREMVFYSSGWDYFTPDAGKKDKMFCEACGTEMDVERNVRGVRGISSTTAGWFYSLPEEEQEKRKSNYDKFTCPYAGYPWHTQVIKLVEKAERSPSKKIQDLLMEEANEIIKNKQATKIVSRFFGD